MSANLNKSAVRSSGRCPQSSINIRNLLVTSMRSLFFSAILTAAATPFLMSAANPEPRIIRVTDTVFVKSKPLDYDELARRVALQISNQSTAKPTVIAGDLIVKGRLSIGGNPEPETDYAITVHSPNAASIRLISNEALADPQRASSQHRHVGTMSVGQDGGLRIDQNSTCYTDDRSCTVDDPHRRRAYHGYDSMGDMSFYLSDVDSLTGKETAPRTQSLVLSLLSWDGHIHFNSYRPGQRIYFNGSKTPNAADLQWEVPLSPVPAIR